MTSQPLSSCVALAEVDATFNQPGGTPLASTEFGPDYPLNGATTIAALSCVQGTTRVGLFDSDGVGLVPAPTPGLVLGYEWTGAGGESLVTIATPLAEEPRFVVAGATDLADPLSYYVQSGSLTPVEVTVSGDVAPTPSAPTTEASGTDDGGNGAGLVVVGVLAVLAAVVVAVIVRARRTSSVVTKGSQPPPPTASEELLAAGQRARGFLRSMAGRRSRPPMRGGT